MKHYFFDTEMLDKVDRITNEIDERWGYPAETRWQLWDMVATVFIGKARDTRFEDGGIIVRGWNDGGFKNPDPKSAHGGFYRLERAQMVGTMIRYVAQKDPEERVEEAERLRWVWSECIDVIYEPQHRVWGYVAQQDVYTEDEAQQLAERTLAAKGTRRAAAEYSEMSGMWRVRWETTRKASTQVGVTDAQRQGHWRHVTRQRINDCGAEMTR